MRLEEGARADHGFVCHARISGSCRKACGESLKAFRHRSDSIRSTMDLRKISPTGGLDLVVRRVWQSWNLENLTIRH